MSPEPRTRKWPAGIFGDLGKVRSRVSVCVCVKGQLRNWVSGANVVTRISCVEKKMKVFRGIKRQNPTKTVKTNVSIRSCYLNTPCNCDNLSKGSLARDHFVTLECTSTVYNFECNFG